MPAAVSSIISGLSAVKTSFELMKSLRELVSKPDVNPTEVQARLLEVEALLMDARRGLIAAEDENRELLAKVRTFERYADIGNNFTFEEGVYWYRNYPYCPNCWDVDRKPVRLDGPFGMGSFEWECSEHKSKYYLDRHQTEITF